MELKIVPATWKHHALLADLGSTTFFETFSKDNDQADMNNYVSKTYNKEQMVKNMADPAIKYFVVYGQDNDLGYIKLLHNVEIEGLSGKTIELEKIYVRSEALGLKVGKALMECAIQYAKEKGYAHLFLGVWQQNERAISFYKKFGFNTFRTRQFTLGKRVCDDYLMALSF